MLVKQALYSSYNRVTFWNVRVCLQPERLWRGLSLGLTVHPPHRNHARTSSRKVSASFIVARSVRQKKGVTKLMAEFPSTELPDLTAQSMQGNLIKRNFRPWTYSFDSRSQNFLWSPVHMPRCKWPLLCATESGTVLQVGGVFPATV